ncbi:MAG: hypothetical protein KER_00015 [Kerstersia gyiorum]
MPGHLPDMQTKRLATPRLARLSLPLALATLLLGACSTPMTLPADTTLDSATTTLGAPTSSCPLANGGLRAVWSQQPQGQYAWAMDFDAEGRQTKREPVLTNESFERLRTGTWTQQDVTCAFGPPARTGWVGLPSLREQVWGYRYRENGVWNSVMYVFFGMTGEKVTRFYPGPDPRFDDNAPWNYFDF